MSDFIKIDKLNAVIKSIAALTKADVLVGIPAENADREDGKANNALIGYVNEHGSPLKNIPPRPHLVPGVAASKGEYSPKLVKAASFALDGKKGEAMRQLESAGSSAEKGVKSLLTNGNFEPLKPSTIRNRRRQRKTKSMRESEKRYFELLSEGMTAEGAQNEVGIQPLINTTEYLKSITHVIREK